MIELAPHHKIGLSLHNPIMPASGFIGYGKNPYSNIYQLNNFGAIVTNSITLRPTPHQHKPHITGVTGGVLVNTQPRNPGVRRVIQRNQRYWENNAVPFIAHLPFDDADDLARTARALDGLGVLSGFELGIPAQLPITEIRNTLQAIRYNCEIPIIVKIPSAEVLDLAEEIIGYDIDALTVDFNRQHTISLSDKEIVSGTYYGLGTLLSGLSIISELKARHPQIPLVASGGIHTQADVESYLQAGAVAVQLDTLIFTNPLAVRQLLTRFSQGAKA